MTPQIEINHKKPSKMNKILILLLLCFSANVVLVASQSDPTITRWFRSTGVGFMNIVANITQIQYSARYVYVSCNSIPGYNIGPWANNPNTPAAKGYTFQFPRVPPTNEVLTKTNVPLGHIGLWVNGVSIYNADDGMTYLNQGSWKRNAYFFEGVSFDYCRGHAGPNGEYHHHVNPKCVYDYKDSSRHSPIIGFAFDGYPIYGQYGYSSPLDASSRLKMMTSSYRTRSITVRTTYTNGSTAAYPGPPVSLSYPLGSFLEDHEYVPGLGDLDAHNGRFCITPEYPSGVYAYFVTADANGDPIYPFVIGPKYYGQPLMVNIGPNSGKVVPAETVTTYFMQKL